MSYKVETEILRNIRPECQKNKIDTILTNQIRGEKISIQK